MIQVETPGRVTYHNTFEVRVASEGNEAALIFVEGPDTHVYVMPKQNAQKTARGERGEAAVTAPWPTVPKVYVVMAGDLGEQRILGAFSERELAQDRADASIEACEIIEVLVNSQESPA